MIFRLTVAQYHELIRSGKLTDEDPVELLEGILVYKMPKNTPHATSTKLVRREIEPRLPLGWHYQTQDPITLGDGEPEPDGAVVRGKIEDYAKHHPGPSDVALVIEVADSSLERDRGIKLRSYARAGIPVYWIINVEDRQVERYREPTAPGGVVPSYQLIDIYREGESIPLALPGSAEAAISVNALLPPP
jgi:Uma2 family endonuclease